MRKYGELVYVVVYLTEEQYYYLSLLCNYFGISRSALLRSLVDEFIAHNRDIVEQLLVQKASLGGGEVDGNNEGSGVGTDRQDDHTN